MNCLEFRRLIGAEPARSGGEIDEHVRTCSACAEFAQQMRALDRRLVQALSVAAPARRRRRLYMGHGFAQKKRWALAASLVIAVGAASLLWLAYPSATLAHDVVAHAGHEPASWSAGDAEVSSQKLARILHKAGLSQNSQLGRISYARSCWFRGHFVPHLVVQDEAGPIMVMVLREETVSAPMRFAEGGYSGIILPAPRGSVAVLAQADARLDAVAARLLHALQ